MSGRSPLRSSARSPAAVQPVQWLFNVLHPIYAEFISLPSDSLVEYLSRTIAFQFGSEAVEEILGAFDISLSINRHSNWELAVVSRFHQGEYDISGYLFFTFGKQLLAKRSPSGSLRKDHVFIKAFAKDWFSMLGRIDAAKVATVFSTRFITTDMKVIDLFVTGIALFYDVWRQTNIVDFEALKDRVCVRNPSRKTRSISPSPQRVVSSISTPPPNASASPITRSRTPTVCYRSPSTPSPTSSQRASVDSNASSSANSAAALATGLGIQNCVEWWELYAGVTPPPTMSLEDRIDNIIRYYASKPGVAAKGLHRANQTDHPGACDIQTQCAYESMKLAEFSTQTAHAAVCDAMVGTAPRSVVHQHLGPDSAGAFDASTHTYGLVQFLEKSVSCRAPIQSLEVQTDALEAAETGISAVVGSRDVGCDPEIRNLVAPDTPDLTTKIDAFDRGLQTDFVEKDYSNLKSIGVTTVSPGMVDEGVIARPQVKESAMNAAAQALPASSGTEDLCSCILMERDRVSSIEQFSDSMLAFSTASDKRLEMLSSRIDRFQLLLTRGLTNLFFKVARERELYIQSIHTISKELQSERDSFDRSKKLAFHHLQELKSSCDAEIERLGSKLSEVSSKLADAHRKGEGLEAQIQRLKPGGEDFLASMEIEMRRQKLRACRLCDVKRLVALRCLSSATASSNSSNPNVVLSAPQIEDLALFFTISDMGSDLRSFFYKSEVVRGSRAPQWKEIPLNSLSGNDGQAASFLVRIFDSKKLVPRREALVSEQWINLASLTPYSSEKDYFDKESITKNVEEDSEKRALESGLVRYHLVLLTIGNQIYYCPLLTSS
eukprot:ANDGO_05916.mRNA.1 hypothetical protein